MAQAPNERLLLVEGQADKRVLCEVFEKGTGLKWEPKPKHYLVDIQDCGDDLSVLKQMDVRWKESGRKFLGIVIDADTSPRWSEVRRHAPAEIREKLPDTLPAEGLVFEANNGRRFGVWIMPDNQSPGMLETFLAELRT